MSNRVSVIIPAYNSANFLPEAIESVLKQTYPVFEIIVVDDGSTDETKQVCDRYPTIKYIYQSNQGLIGARNTGFEASTGEYILFLDSDDTILPDAVESGINAITAHPEAGFVFGNYALQSQNPDGSYINEEIYENHQEVANYENILAGKIKLQCACILFQRQAIESVGAFDPKTKGAEDYNLYLRIAREFPIYAHGQLVSTYRYHGGNVSANPAAMLINSLNAHSLQLAFIQQSGNKEYAAAYEQGRQAWIKLFIERIPYEIKRFIQSEKWLDALGYLQLLLHYDPKLKFVDQKIYEISYQALLSQLRELPIESSLAYWKQQLAGVAPLLSLPTDRPRPAEQHFQGAEQSFIISEKLTTALSLFSQQENVSLFMTLLAAFDTLLYRYTGTEDIIVGSPLTNYEDSEVFVNAVALRTDMSGNPSFHNLLQRVQNVVADATLHQQVPYLLLLEELNIPRDSSYSPLFQVLLIIEDDVSFEKIELSSLSACPWIVDNNALQYDLVLYLKPTNNGLAGKWVYNTDLFDSITIERINGHFHNLLQSIIANPRQPISGLTILTDEERQKLLFQWNNTQIQYPQDKCIHRWFEEQVERTPNAVAVVFEKQQLTYRQLNNKANQLANYLITLGVKADTFVGICVERSLDMIVGILGILKAGGAYVPLDPKNPQDRLEYILTNAQVQILVTQSALVNIFPVCEQMICLDTDNEKIAQYSDNNPIVSVQSHNIAYIIYTSGSTGKPKGVLVSHYNVVRLFTATESWYHFNERDVWTLFHSFAFDFSVWEIWGALLYGGRVVIVPYLVSRDTEAFYNLLVSEQVTVLNQTPSAFYQLIEADKLANSRDELSLRLVIFGGEALNLSNLQPWFERHGDKSPQLVNMYGITETTVHVTYRPLTLADAQATSSLIGRPIPDLQVYLLDQYLQPVPIGVWAEMYVGGAGVAQGYWQRDELTKERFIKHPFSDDPNARLYKTGDLARYLSDGSLEYIGRIDNQVKIRGFRIELGEIESALSQHPAINQTVVTVYEDRPGDKRLVAYLVPNQEQQPTINDLRDFLSQQLPDYMIPSAFVMLETLPLTSNGKVDRKALPAPNRKIERQDHTTPTSERSQFHPVSPKPQNEIEKLLTTIWQEVLTIDEIGIDDNFFELGGHSLLIAKLRNKIVEVLGIQISIVDVFQYSTIRSLAQCLLERNLAPTPSTTPNNQYKSNSDVIEPAVSTKLHKDIAIIGMAGRFPGAANINEFWQNLRDGVESIAQLSDEELSALGVDSSLLNNPNYIRAAAIIPKIAEFDAAFFGYSPREAQVIDPQQRIYLECAWSALEDAGYQPDSHRYTIGIYGGVAPSNYLLNNILQNDDLAEGRLVESASWLQAFIGNSTDFLNTRVAYKLNLTGPAINLQTGCSTSLVAIHMACQSLLRGECDMALAGGVSLQQKTGYVYEEGMVFSPDGHCHAFDAEAKGMVAGDGVGIVVLKPLQQAIADGDHIYATIKGSAINNDGNLKVGFTAPGVDGQATVIAAAHRDAGIEPETITYIETHGTGTPLGDPIEVAGLTQAFRLKTDKTGYCAIGSVKTNVGHLNTAAGVTGFIKTALALKHQQIPPSLNFEKPNPEIDFTHSPFYVNTKLSAWERNGSPRRAGVSAFGFGGTNAHVVLEEWDASTSKSKVKAKNSQELLVLSAKTASALDTATLNLANYLQQNPDINLADVAYTLGIGRVGFNHRRIVAVSDIEDAVNALNTRDKKRVFTNSGKIKPRSVVFMFSGQGSQYVNMARELYETEAYFQEQVDLCCEILQPHLGFNLRDVLYPNAEEIATATVQLTQTATTQPALFVIEYAIAKLWMKWGVIPVAMIGHSIGEYVAATLAGVFSLEDALALVAARGQLMESMPPGSMLAVPLPEHEVQPLLVGTSLQIAVINSPANCVVSGTKPAIEAFAKQLAEKEIEGRLLHTSHAFHSQMMAEILEPFTDKVKQIRLNVPKIPFVSNVTGTWITVEDATNPNYYAQHLRQAVRFADGVKQFFENPEQILLEVGPGRTLSTLAQRHPDKPKEQITLTSVRHPQDEYSDVSFLLNNLGQMWLAGLEINWSAFYSEQPHYRLPLPTYPFERKRYWIEPSKQTQKIQPSATKSLDIFDESEVDKSLKTETSSEQLSPQTELIQTPQEQLEQTIINIWQQVLGIDNIGLDDNFFELGGDSLVAVQLLSKLRKNIDLKAYSGLELSLDQLFKTPTIAELLATLTIAKTDNLASTDSQALAIRPRANRDSALLSYPQQSLWFLHQLEPNRSDYHISQAVHLTGTLNVEALQQSLDAIVVRHEVLRTNYISENGEPIQVISPPRPVELQIIDLQDCPQSEQETAVKEYLNQETQRIFHLSEDLMLRGCLLKIAAEEHILLLVTQHIATDGESMAVISKELKALYTAFCNGESPKLAELPIQYGDFAIWQQEWLQGEVLESLLGYWQKQMVGAPALLPLPTDRPRPAVQTYRGSSHYFTLSHELIQGLSLLSQKEGVTLFMTLLAAFDILLYRYTNSEDIVVGVPFANRNRQEIAGLVGFFVNTLAMRTPVSGELSVQELLGRVKEVTLGAYTHSDLPFEKLVAELHPQRDLSYSPLFQVLLVFADNPFLQNQELPGLKLSEYSVEKNTAQFDLTLFLITSKNEEGLRCEWEYNTDLFDSDTISRMAANFEVLLTAIVANPQQAISELPLLTALEKQKLLVDWNDTQTDYPQDKCLPQLFAEQVEKTPDAIAVVFEEQKLTYRELNNRANQLAHYLRKLGVQPDVGVGICVERSLEMVVGLLGILKAGGAYVPLDPAYPKDRLSFMLKNSQATVLVTTKNLVAELPTHETKVVCLDSNWSDINQESQDNLVTGVKAENLAYVIHTSGSTGMPKGVAMTQIALCNLILWQIENTTVLGEAKTLQFSPISFDVSFQEMFSTWCSGGTLVLIAEELRRDPLTLLNLLDQQAVNRLFLPFVALQQLAEVAVTAKLFPLHLREVITAGEQLQITPAIQEFFTQVTNCTLHNHYGPSESHVVTTFTLDNSVQNWPKLPPIGKAIANTQIYILDSRMQPVPIGVAGELYIGGDCLARGYLNRDDLTSARFIANPLSNDPNARLYKTGDLCRYLSDGNIEYLGRIDNQVKVRGFRIELGEIEALLSQHPDIAQVSIIVREDIPGDKRLVAYFVPHQEPAPTSSELRHFLQQKLPDYMLPAAFVMLESLPLTPSGKVDRRALPAIDNIRQGTEATFVAPQEELEVRLTKIWEDVLNVRPIGIKDNFFELGGHSLLAVRLFAEIEKMCGQKLPLATLFQAQTIEQLASVLRESGWSAPWSSLVLIKPGEQKPPLFCVHPVGGNILEYQAVARYLDPDQPVYGIQAVGLDGKQQPLRRVEDMAQHYIEAIRSVQPNGPYFLAGYSFGGLVAFEMARQLNAQGQNVAHLALFDRSAPNFVSIRPSLLQCIQIHLNNIWQLEHKDRWNYIKARVLYRSGQVNYKQGLLEGLSELQTLTPQYLNLIDCNEQAAEDYKPQGIYPGNVSLYRCKIQRPQETLSADFGWSNLVAGNVEILDIPGEHYGMLREPRVRILAEILQRCLKQANQFVM
ncbi:amino acid adenylation domain-containing protein [Tolypothrix tenuis PCC 7101]|uniref:Phenolphthiocerol/phthiocerol polyketide synthase subunit E n=1 Tax=Tolypothrix tenuis PCC 7101 TaxID=231146 RepID=A0A1Z4N2Z8_9CYAN|nr:amino acid adenylation domain-containing protein [Tolypothrix tenuis PCC 7101]BAZ75991.1 amino acid adenylation domain-containing protein [Aulosira laxa NIES-50]